MTAQRMSSCRARHSGWARVTALTRLFLCSLPAMDALAQPEDMAELPAVIVTARKVREESQNVPSAVTTHRAEDVDRFDVTTIEKAAAVTSGLIVTRGNTGSGASISLRGIGPSLSSIGIEQSVAVIVDGVYYGQGRVINEAFFDLTQIDILKGPQALYWGKNSTAGVLSITSANPTRERELLGRVGYEFRSANRMAGFVVSGPVAEKIGMRLAVNAQNMQSGYVRNDAPAGTYTTTDVATSASTAHPVGPPGERELPAERSFAARLTATYQPDSSLDMALKATVSHRRTGSPAWNVKLWKCPNDSGGEPCGEGFSTRQNPLPSDVAATRTLMNRYGGQPYTLYDSQGLTLKVDKTLPKVALSSITNGQRFAYSLLSDYDYTGTPLIWADEDDHYHAFSEELRASTTLDLPVNFMAGLYFQQTELQFAQGAALFGSENSLASASDRYLAFWRHSATRGQTTAAYGQVTWNFRPGWEYVLGGRYTRERKTSYTAQPYVHPAFAAAYLPDARLDADQHFENFSPATTLTWKPERNLTLYAAYKTGYKSGGFSNSATISTTGNGVADAIFAPETVKGFEAGIKATLLDNRLRLSIDAYHYDYDDLQLDFYDAQRLTLTTTNAGSAVVKGLEVAADYLPPSVNGLKLVGSAQYNIARYGTYIAPCYTGQTQSQGCLAASGGTLRQDLAGKPTANAPAWTGSVGADYDRPLLKDLLFGLSVRLHYSSKYSISPFGQPLAEQPSYVNFDAALRLGAADDSWQVALIGKNLTNNFVATAAYDQNGTGSASGGQTGTFANQLVLFAPPRTVALELTARF